MGPNGEATYRRGDARGDQKARRGFLEFFAANIRKPTLTHHQQQEAIKRVKAGKETLGEIARSHYVSRWTISRLTHEVTS